MSPKVAAIGAGIGSMTMRMMIAFLGQARTEEVEGWNRGVVKAMGVQVLFLLRIATTTTATATTTIATLITRF